MNFVDISKKGNKYHDHKVSTKNDKKMFCKFLVIGFSKELVVIADNPNKYSFSLWNRLNKKTLVPRGVQF